MQVFFSSLLAKVDFPDPPEPIIEIFFIFLDYYDSELKTFCITYG
jgi:hypothetical protein